MSKKPDKAKKPSPQTTNGPPIKELAVRDFGPIVEGKIDLRPLTVFTGPSNTGKSWMAALVYVLEWHRNALLDSFVDMYRRQLDLSNGELRFKFPENPETWIEAINSNKKTIRLTRNEIKFIRSLISTSSDYLSHELQRCYGSTALGSLVRHGRAAQSSIVFPVGNIEYTLNLKSNGAKKARSKTGDFNLRANIPDNLEVSLGPGSERLLEELNELRYIQSANDNGFARKKLLRSGIAELVIDGHTETADIKTFTGTYYLPAGRGGTMDSYTTILNSLVVDASRAGIRSESRFPALSGISGDFLENIFGIINHEVNLGEGEDTVLSRSLEEKVLHGKIIVKKLASGYPVIYYKPKHWKSRSLLLINVSSMVLEVSPVVLFLRHAVGPGDTLILEEPEAHLHPEAQQQFVEEIASWVRAGIKVILTTHSEWILESLSNIVAKGEIRKKPKNGSVYLDKKDVGVWLFDHIDSTDKSQGSKIKEIPWNMDEGGYEVGFYKVTVDIHNTFADSINRLNKEDKEKAK